MTVAQRAGVLAPATVALDVSFEDGFGRRTRGLDGDTADEVEFLELTETLVDHVGFVTALSERVVRVANARHASYARVRRLDRPAPHRLVLVSDTAPGWRLSELLRVAAEHHVPVETSVVIGLLRQLLPAVALFARNNRESAIGNVAPERLHLTPQARLVITEHPFGAAIEKLAAGRDRLWREFRVAIPPAAGLPRIDSRADAHALGVVALSLLLGRTLADDEYPAKLQELVEGLHELKDGKSVPLSPGLEHWLLRALQLDSRAAFQSPQEAHLAFESMLASERSYVTTPTALENFVSRVGELIDLDRVSAGPATAEPPKPVEPEVLRVVVPVPLPPPPVERPEPVAPPVFTPPPVAVAPMSSAPSHAALVVLREPVAPPPAPAPVIAALTPAPAPVEPAPAPAPPIAMSVAPMSTDREAVKDRPEPQPEPPAAPPAPVAALPAPVPPSSVSETPAAPPRAIFSSVTEAPPEPARDRIGIPVTRSSLALTLAALAILQSGVLFWLWSHPPGSAPNGTGQLVVQSRPASARVTIDGEDKGTSPVTVELPAGAHVLELRVGTSEPRVIPITIQKGVQTAQYIELQSVPLTGGLDLRSEPAGARVSIDGQKRGATPVRLTDLPPGDHELLFDAPSGSLKQTVHIDAGVTTQVTVRMPGK